jgi:hypothetical protein
LNLKILNPSQPMLDQSRGQPQKEQKNKPLENKKD